MRAPPLLIGLTLMFWGYQSGMLWASSLMAILFEVSFIWRQRWQLDRGDYYRVWDFCTVLFVASALYCFVSRDTTNDLMEFFQATNFSKRNQVMNNAFATAFIFFQWMPMVFFPIVLAQAYSEDPAIPYSTFSWMWRRQLRRGKNVERGYLNVTFPYFAIIIFATSLVNERDPVFFMGMSLLSLFALAAIRPRRYSPFIWAPLALLVVALGYFGQVGMQRAQGAMETSFAQWLSQMLNRNQNPRESRTALGRLGRLKLSGKIVMQVEVKGAPVELLREATYDNFSSPSWLSSRTKYEDVSSDTNAMNWVMLPDKKPDNSVIISAYFSRGKATVPVPTGMAAIESLLAEQMQTNLYGVVVVSNATAFARYTAKHGPGMTIDSEPHEIYDRAVPDMELETVQKVLQQTGLKTTDSLPKKLEGLQRFFAENYQYSTWQGPTRHRRETPLKHFLLHSKAGHCEFFATATVLLLRKLDVPARYAVGYAVQEADNKVNHFVVRERHGHAWVLYFDAQEKVWKDFDTTPPDWASIEEKANASMFQPVSDLWSRFRFQISEWRWLTDREKLRNYMLWFLLALIALLGWRIFRRNKVKRVAGEGSDGRSGRGWPGLDSEFYAIEERLRKLGLERQSGESLQAWLQRVRELKPELVKQLPPLMQLHYRYRFDPAGLTKEEREQLKQGVNEWMRVGAASS